MRSDTETRAFRCSDGAYTTIKLECRWWAYVDKIAEREKETSDELLRLIFDGTNPPNRASVIRLWVVDYLVKLAKIIIKRSTFAGVSAPSDEDIFLR